MFRNPLFTGSLVWLASLASSSAAGGGGHHALPLHAERLHPWLPISNSMIMVWLAVLLLIVFCQLAAGKLTFLPKSWHLFASSFAEWAVESLYDFLENLLGPDLTKKTFWFFGSIFFFILTSNYLGLIPGVGTVGQLDQHGHLVPWLRGANADVNMTSAMALTFFALWTYWAIRENSLKGFFAHIFAPKGAFTGILKIMMVLIFFLVGLLEVVSIFVRPLALTFRLFGNIYGGEQTMEKLMDLVPHHLQAYLSWAPALPFYFMELLVGFVQALVFTLLCAIFLKLICDHGDEHHEESHH